MDVSIKLESKYIKLSGSLCIPKMDQLLYLKIGNVNWEFRVCAVDHYASTTWWYMYYIFSLPVCLS